MSADHSSANRSRTEAENFLTSFRWVSQIKKIDSRFEIDGIVSVYLFEIEPAETGVDKLLWVIVGDLPPAYLVMDRAPDPRAALTVYIEEMELWVNAVKRGEFVEELIPVNVPPTLEWAGRLESRLNFLKEKVLEQMN